MKKLILLSAATMTAVSVFGQGTVAFLNNTATAVSNITTSARVVGGTTFSVALYYLPDSATPPVAGDFTENGVIGKGFFSGAPGIFNVGTRTAPTPAPGGVGWFQVRAWETAYGSTWEQAVNAPAIGGRLALAGTSNVIKVTLGNPTTTPPGTAGSLTGSGLLSFYVVPVPEPSVIGLGLLGVGALMLLRRRK
jgi:hypothetical protein